MGGSQPFDHVALHGLVRDSTGKKMSKSRGNVIDPLDWLDRFGADATRFTLSRGANPGSDMAIAEDWAAGSRNFCNKLWNATRFALMNGATVSRPVPARDTLTDADRWVLDLTDAVVSEVDALYEDYQFAKLCDALYHFTWDELCDWYLEIAKVQISEGGERADSTRAVLGHVFDVVLRLLHPLIPFVTESLWTTLTGGESLVIADWPAATGTAADADAARRVAGVQKLVTEVRRFRNDQGVKPNQRVPARLSGVDAAGLSPLARAVSSLARLEEPGEAFTPSASVEVSLPSGHVHVELDLSGAVDLAAERKRLEKDLAAARKELAGTEAKLGNANFTDKAPAEVVEKIRARRDVAAAEIDRIAKRLESFGD
jgi:valyl-tRNA synthetase